MEFAVGGSDMAEYVPLLEEELALLGRGPTRTRRGARPTSRPTPSSASSSSAPGCRACSPPTACRPPGVDFVVLEKNDDVGGTWYENSYPGCRVDNPNHNYSYSFAQRHDWPFHFSSQDVLLDYFRRCADDFGLRDHIRFGTEVRLGYVVRGRPALDDPRARRRRPRGIDRSERGDQRRRSAEPPVVSSDPRSRLVRRSVVPLGAVGPRRRPARQAGRGHRNRRERGAVHPRDRRRRRASRGVPAHATVDGPDTRVPRRGPRRAAMAVRARAVVQRVEPLLDLLEDGRRRAAGRAGRSRMGAATTARSAR